MLDLFLYVVLIGTFYTQRGVACDLLFCEMITNIVFIFCAKDEESEEDNRQENGEVCTVYCNLDNKN